MILLRPAEAARELAISERTLRELHLPYVRIGRCVRYRLETLAEEARLRETVPQSARHGPEGH